jgi:hypothetical protein
MRRAGLANGIVDATPTRKILNQLSRRGIGYKTVAKNAGVSRTVLAKVKNGTRLQVRANTARLVAEFGDARKPQSLIIPAAGTWRQIRSLLEEGFTKAEIARRIGLKTPALQLRRDRIIYRTAARIEHLWISMQ